MAYHQTGSIEFFPRNVKWNTFGLDDFLCKGQETLVMVIFYNDQVKNVSCRDEQNDSVGGNLDRGSKEGTQASQ